MVRRVEEAARPRRWRRWRRWCRWRRRRSRRSNLGILLWAVHGDAGVTGGGEAAAREKGTAKGGNRGGGVAGGGEAAAREKGTAKGGNRGGGVAGQKKSKKRHRSRHLTHLRNFSEEVPFAEMLGAVILAAYGTSALTPSSLRAAHNQLAALRITPSA
eukprot:7279777-Prymnesium_polylepis.1